MSQKHKVSFGLKKKQPVKIHHIGIYVHTCTHDREEQRGLSGFVSCTSVFSDSFTVRKYASLTWADFFKKSIQILKIIR